MATTNAGKWLSGVNVCVGDCAGLSVTEKLRLKSLIASAGGTVTYLVHPKTTHLVTGEDEVRGGSQKVRSACKYGVRVVSPAWLFRCEAAGSRQDETPFLISLDQDKRSSHAESASTTADLAGEAANSSPATASTTTMGSSALVGRRGKWLTTTSSSSSTSSSALGEFAITLQSDVQPLYSTELGATSSSAASTSIFGTDDDDDPFMMTAMERRVAHNLRLGLEIARLLVPPTSVYWEESASLPLLRLLHNPTSGKAATKKAAKKEKWALKLEEKQKQIQAAAEKRKGEKEKRERERARLLRRTVHSKADSELMQSFKAEAKDRAQQRREQKRNEKLARLREGWLAEIARRKKREEEREEEKRKRREAWEEKQREKQRRRDEYERKRLEWLSKQAEREQKQKEWEAQIQRWETQKREELYKKFFVGNLKWTDISVEEMGSETAVEFARQKRWERLREIFHSFGPVSEIKEHWSRNFVFVVYLEREHAEKAMEVLSSWDERVARTQAIRKQLLDEGQPLIYTPPPNFYLRWPKKEPHPDPEEEKKLKEDVEQIKLEIQKKKEAEEQDAADGWEKTAVTSKKKLRAQAQDEEATLAALAEAEAKANAPPDLRPKKQSDGKSKKKREKRKKKEAEKREKEKKKGKGKFRPDKFPKTILPNAIASNEQPAIRGRGGMRGGARGGLRGGRGGRGGALEAPLIPMGDRPAPGEMMPPNLGADVVALRGRGGLRGGRGGLRGGRGGRGGALGAPPVLRPSPGESHNDGAAMATLRGRGGFRGRGRGRGRGG